jgi:hypothetical protein
MEENESSLQKKAGIEIIILKPRLDSDMARLKGEKLKTSFFSSFGFLKPNDKNVTIVALNRFYEPFVIVGGKYSIDYCNRHIYTIEVEDETRALLINGRSYVSQPPANGKRNRVVKFIGEEYPSYQIETYLVLDRTLQEVPPEKLLLAPFDHELEKQQAPVFDVRKLNIRFEDAIECLRARIVRRPSDVEEIIKESFEITCQIAVFKPTYELVFYNHRDGNRVTTLMDGVTGEISFSKSMDFPRKRFDEFSEFGSQDLKTDSSLLSPRTKGLHHNEKGIFSSAPIEESNLSSKTESKLDSSISDSNFIGCLLPEAKEATSLAITFLRSLGYESDLEPKKLSRTGEEYLVEIAFDKGMAKVKVDEKTKDVQDYKIEIEGKHFQSQSTRNIIIVFLAVLAALSFLKLVNFF